MYLLRIQSDRNRSLTWFSYHWSQKQKDDEKERKATQKDEQRKRKRCFHRPSRGSNARRCPAAAAVHVSDSPDQTYGSDARETLQTLSLRHEAPIICGPTCIVISQLYKGGSGGCTCCYQYKSTQTLGFPASLSLIICASPSLCSSSSPVWSIQTR